MMFKSHQYTVQHLKTWNYRIVFIISWKKQTKLNNTKWISYPCNNKLQTDPTAEGKILFSTMDKYCQNRIHNSENNLLRKHLSLQKNTDQFLLLYNKIINSEYC